VSGGCFAKRRVKEFLLVRLGLLVKLLLGVEVRKLHLELNFKELV